MVTDDGMDGRVMAWSGAAIVACSLHGMVLRLRGSLLAMGRDDFFRLLHRPSRELELVRVRDVLEVL